jgi:L-threonylcarbamoyladenylate synthase
MAKARATPIVAVNESTIALAAAQLRDGGLVAMATDTVYGIAAACDSRKAIGRLYALKGRSAEKALPVLIADREQLDGIARMMSPEAEVLIDAFWPGALTLVLERSGALLPELAPNLDTIGVRLPDHAGVCAVIRALGVPIACSSANPSGAPPATSSSAVRAYFPSGLDLLLDGGVAAISTPSTVVDVSQSGRARVLREGAITRERIAAILGAPV